MTTFDTQLPAAFGKTRYPISVRAWMKAVDQALTRALDAVLDWHDRARQRHQLLGLSDIALRDFAASRADATAEGDKAFWHR